MIRILNAEPDGYSQEAREILCGIGEVVDGSLSRVELIERVSEFDVLIVRLAHHIDSEIMDAGTRLRAIVSATTGLDHIDLNAARERGIDVLSLRGKTQFLRTVSATAELTWALVLGLLRHIPQAFESVRNGEWDRDAFRGHELEGKRLGIVGLGRIGRMVARYGLAFGMSVAAHDPHAGEDIHGVQQEASLENLLEKTDVLSIHVPLNDNTVGLIGHQELRLLPKGAVVVNTSRGSIVDEAALVQALKDGALAGAALDVVADERDAALRRSGPLMAYLHEHDNLLIVPHIGGATYESMRKTEVFMARQLAAFLEGATRSVSS